MTVGLESDERLAQLAQENLTALGVTNAAVIVGDPAAGAVKQGPYDLIFIAAAIEQTPTRLLEQLKDGGRLAAIVANRTGSSAERSIGAAAAPARPLHSSMQRPDSSCRIPASQGL